MYRVILAITQPLPWPSSLRLVVHWPGLRGWRVLPLTGELWVDRFWLRVDMKYSGSFAYLFKHAAAGFTRASGL